MNYEIVLKQKRKRRTINGNKSGRRSKAEPDEEGGDRDRTSLLEFKNRFIFLLVLSDWNIIHLQV